MPKRRQKGTDTEREDSFEEEHPVDKTYTFGTIQVNRFLPPDELAEDDPNRYSIRSWSHVLMAHKLIPWDERKALFERALRCLPNSYKIWHEFLVEFRDYCDERSLFCSDYDELNKKFEEALKYLPKMPRIWLLYAETLAKQNLISKTRQTYNWSFRNLPLTQHQKIWAKFAPWTFTLSNPRTAIQVINRYLQLNPDFKQNYADYLRQRGEYDLAAKVINNILQDEGYHSKQGKTKDDFLSDLIELFIEQPTKIKSINGEEIIRKAIEDHPSESSHFWVKLCSYFIRLAEFEKARESFEKALNAIDNAKDFNLIFSTYTKFQEQMLMALQHEGIRKEESVTMEDKIDEEIGERLAKLESLIDRRPYMLSNINIKKEPNFVRFWIKLADLHKNAGNMELYIETLIKATETIKPEEAENGHFSEIWILRANYFKQRGDLQKFNELSMESTRINYRTVDDYISSWTRWCQSLIQLNYSQDALEIVKHVLLRRRQPSNPELKIKNIDDILKSSVLLWSLYIDLQLSIGTFDTAKKAYQRCREHKSLNPLMLLNYINLLWERNHFQEVFRVFEYAIQEFKWPYVYEIWLSYVSKFVERYGSSPIGVERTRSIFQRLLRDVPPKQCKIFYFIYAEFEEEYGLYSHAIEIYDRMIAVVPEGEKYQCYNIYIAKISQLLGVTKTRAVFESALQKLSEGEIVLMALKYAELQKNLNEVERARQVYSYASQFTDPKDDYQGLWKAWQQFQLAEGNKDNYQMYLRVKRSVINKYAMLPPDLRRIQQNVRKGVL